MLEVAPANMHSAVNLRNGMAFGLVALSTVAHAQLFTDLRSTQFSYVAGVVSTFQGPVVIGAGGDEGFTTSRWSAVTGKVPILSLHTEPYPFRPEDVSTNGKVIVGRGAGFYEPVRPSAYRWTEQTGLQELTSNIRDTTFSVRTRVSGDGSTVTGFGASAAFRWTQSTGTTFIGAALNGIEVINHDNPLFFPNAISRNGTVIAGMNTVDPFQMGEASKWTQETGLVGLGFLFNNGTEETSVATGITGNGSVIVGTGVSDGQYSEAFRWTASGGMESLGVMPGGSSSFATGITGDGGRIFGGTIFADHPFTPDPFVWTARDGMRSLTDVLLDRGAGSELQGWQLLDITAFTADGRYVVGHGIGPDGGQGFYLADLGFSPVPEPAMIALVAGAGLLSLAVIRRRRRTMMLT